MLHKIRPASGSRTARKRVARGNSGAGGTTAGRGTKGQQSRTGKGRNHGFEGGQVPLIMRQPKLGGFKRDRKIYFTALNLATLEERLEAGTYTLADLIARNIVKKGAAVKLLGTGILTKKITIEAHAASKSAKDAVKKAGGTITMVKQ